MEDIKNQGSRMERMWRMMVYSFILYLVSLFLISEGNIGQHEEFVSILGGLITTIIFLYGFTTQREDKFYNMASTDVLTGIYNRRKLIEELENLTEKKFKLDKFTLLFLDLDGFKNINDNYGHDTGDQLLKECAKRLVRSVGRNNFVARQGGDEFVIILKDESDREYISKKSQEILKNMEHEFVLNGKTLKISMSIGAAVFPKDALNYRELMKCSGYALAKSKKNGKNQFQIYDEELQKHQIRKSLIETYIKNPQIKEELYILYQPQIDTKSGKLVGIEALLRWRNSELGEVSPKEFIPIAEEVGAIHLIGKIVIEEASKTIKYINEKYGKNIKMGINVSPKQFFSEDILSTLEKNIEENGIDPKWLDIEITENTAMTNDSTLIVKLREMSRLGLTISIDDFGTGYSSLAYLKNYPVNTLKIAMDLVKDLNKGNKQDYQIVKAVTAMCKELGIETIAEGVENSENFQILKEMGCDRIQGYYFSRPIRLEDVEKDFLQ
ncbi:MAG: putative bifunctional diguanylate cyclase/phosphodiesterase, partial [Fusobacteriaceae bacterium]